MDTYTIRVKEKLESILKNIKHLEFILIQTKIEENQILQAACERIVERIIEDSIKISHIIIKEKGIINREKSFSILADLQFIPLHLAKKLEKIKGMRNMMIHQYDEFDITIFNKSIPDLIKTINEYCSYINK